MSEITERLLLVYLIWFGITWNNAFHEKRFLFRIFLNFWYFWGIFFTCCTNSVLIYCFVCVGSMKLLEIQRVQHLISLLYIIR